MRQLIGMFVFFFSVVSLAVLVKGSGELHPALLMTRVSPTSQYAFTLLGAALVVGLVVMVVVGLTVMVTPKRTSEIVGP